MHFKGNLSRAFKLICMHCISGLLYTQYAFIRHHQKICCIQKIRKWERKREESEQISIFERACNSNRHWIQLFFPRRNFYWRKIKAQYSLIEGIARDAIGATEGMGGNGMEWNDKKRNTRNCYLFYLAHGMKARKTHKSLSFVYIYPAKFSFAGKTRASSFRRVGLSVLHVDFCHRFQKLIMTQLDSIKSSVSVLFFLKHLQCKERKQQVLKMNGSHERRWKIGWMKVSKQIGVVFFHDLPPDAHSQYLIITIRNLCAKKLRTNNSENSLRQRKYCFGHFPISVFPN